MFTAWNCFNTAATRGDGGNGPRYGSRYTEELPTPSMPGCDLELVCNSVQQYLTLGQDVWVRVDLIESTAVCYSNAVELWESFTQVSVVEMTVIQ